MPALLQPIRGIVPPLVTPLTSRDQLDHAGLQRLIEYQIDAGVAGLFMLGSTGEAPSLSYRLRYELVEKTCELVAGRVPILVGVTDTSLDEAIEFTNFSKSAGATAIVAAAPYYYSVGQLEVRDFLWKLADESTLPMFAYNIPPCVKLSLSFDSFEYLSRHPNVCGLKDSAGDIVAFGELLKLRSARPDWTILVGYESLTAQSVLMGGDGGVTGGANLCPNLFVDIFNAADRNDRQEIDRLQADVDYLQQLYSIAGTGAVGYFTGVKVAMGIAGICSGYLAPPFLPADEATRTKIEAFVNTLDLGSIHTPARNGLVGQ